MKKKKNQKAFPEYNYERDGPLLKIPVSAAPLETRWLLLGTVHISIIETSSGLQYLVREPELSGFEQELLPRIKAEVRQRLVYHTLILTFLITITAQDIQHHLFKLFAVKNITHCPIILYRKPQAGIVVVVKLQQQR